MLRRAQAVARLRHPNLVRMLPLPGGAGLAPVLGNARRLADFTLPAGTFKRFDLAQVLRLLLDVLSALAVLHEVVTDGQGFVHGDVAPHNIYVDEHGTARLVPLLNAHVTNVVVPEAAGYAAPEVLAGRPLDARADLFSVGVMLWEALAGKRFRGRAAPIQLAPNLRWAEPLCRIAERASAAQPAARFGSALELSNAIARAAAQQLSHVDSDAWQEEAPTPVFQPRLHLATLRNSTPPPAVLTIVETAPPASAPVMSSSEQLVAKRRTARVVVPLLGLLLVALASASLLKSPGGARRLMAAFPHAIAPSPVVAAASPVAIAPPPVAVTAPPVAVAPAVAVTAPRGTGSAPASAAPASPSPSRPSKPQVVLTPSPRPAKTKPKPRATDSDYGI